MLSGFVSRVKHAASDFKADHRILKDPEQERVVFQEMSINMDLYNDRLPTNEELADRMVTDKSVTDSGMRVERKST